MTKHKRAAQTKPWPQRIRVALGNLRNPYIISVFVLVALWNFVAASNSIARFLEGGGAVRETVREFRDLNLHLQMRFYQVLTHWRPIPFEPHQVALAYIDDDTHWSTYYGDEPTSRQLLAALVTNASKPRTKAAAIGLDIALLAPRDFPAGSDAKERIGEDEALRAAIESAAEQGVPVILAAVYSQNGKGQNLLLPNIYANTEMLVPKHADCQAVSCPAFGYIDLPDDKRLIPLQKKVWSSAGAGSQGMGSFSQALAEAFRQPYAQHRETIPATDRLQEKKTFGNFLPEDQYQRISVPLLAIGDSKTESECAGKIVIIGGHWHELQGYGEYVDQHLSPAGRMSGMGLHANYVETLLQGTFAHEWPLWVDIPIDLFFGLFVYTCFEIWRLSWKIPLLLIGMSVAPVVFAYGCLVTMNIYLDFVLPIELYFLHITYEVLSDFIKEHLHKPGEASIAKS